MNEEIEYAEMLEIPVSTVNVVRKKNRRIRGKNAPNLKERLISRVNNRVNDSDYTQGYRDYAPSNDDYARVSETENIAESAAYAAAEEAFSDASAQDMSAFANESETYAYREGGERLDTVLLSDRKEKRGRRKDRKRSFAPESEFAFDENEFLQNEGGMYAVKEPSERRSGILLTVEFALACALCGTIFLTNVFMPSSAINTFFRNLMPASAEKVDARNYSDFTLTSIVSELSDAEITVSPAGVLSFTDECCVYPAVNGTVSAVTKNADGTYDVKISHTDKFYGVIGGLDYVYYETGDKVYSNVPVGYSKGETAVRVTMYSGEELLNCYTVDDQNCLAWAKSEN